MSYNECFTTLRYCGNRRGVNHTGIHVGSQGLTKSHYNDLHSLNFETMSFCYRFLCTASHSTNNIKKYS